MKIEYNNNIYNFNKSQSINDLTNKKRFLELPMSVWKEILLMKEGSVSPITLLEILIKKIINYDNSKNVNSFIFQDKLYWLDKNTRVGLVNLANSTIDPISLFLDPDVITITPDQLKSYLAKIEVYASKCYLTTQLHLKSAKNLIDVDDIIDYDYTAGYPDKIVLE